MLGMVNTLVPGVSTLTDTVRYFSMYWAIGEFADRKKCDASESLTLIRRAEVALAWASLLEPVSGRGLHGADTLGGLLKKGKTDGLADTGPGSYSPRTWGYWSQYKGSAVVLGLATTERDALRSGPRECPAAIRDMFRPLLEIVDSRSPTHDDVQTIRYLADIGPTSADIPAMRKLMTAGVNTGGPSAAITGNDRTRRSTLRILARSVQLNPGHPGWSDFLTAGVAYGEHIDQDPVLLDESDRAQAWRGLLLRRLSVGSWRILWSALVDRVRDQRDPMTRSQLHDWISDKLPAVTVEDYLANCPDTVDLAGLPAPAEDTVAATKADVIEAAITVLLLGSLRTEQLTGRALAGFGGGSPSRRLFLDPWWVAARRREYLTHPMNELGRVLVDDMLAQSRRVSLRKMRIRSDGRMILPTKLHEREGWYFAGRREGSGNVGLRAHQLGTIGTQLGLFGEVEGKPVVTDVGCEYLDLPS